MLLFKILIIYYDRNGTLRCSMSNATFELYVDRAGQWRWRLRHQNTEIIADSGQGYSSRRAAQNGLKSVMRNASNAPVERVNHTSN